MKQIKKLSRCPRGHLYDGSKYDTCPHCAVTQAPDVTMMPEMPDDEITLAEPVMMPIPPQPQEAPRAGKTQTVFLQGDPTVERSSMTMQYYQKTIGAEPVVGWLVCVRGVHYGQDFRLKAGRNFIGRGGNMDVCLSADRTVSRDRHAILTFDPLGKNFLIQPGESSALCYLNRKPVLVPTELQSGDRISLGDADLIFVPFGGTLFAWDSEKKAF